MSQNQGLRVAGLFAGIGGIELGLRRNGFSTELLCELDPAARAVLAARFPGVRLTDDVRFLAELPEVDIVTAGYPCQDLSQAGPKVGYKGARSGLVDEVFRVVRQSADRPEFIVLENVSYMLRLHKGEAMAHVVRGLENLGYNWAYRTVDARSFGVPQRRQRVIVVASQNSDPRRVLFADDAPQHEWDDSIGTADSDAFYGFYWTEGLRGLGWTKNAVPTVKGGSLLGIPSPPAVWIPKTGEVGTPELEDGERLQGFEADWTAAAEQVNQKRGARWKLVGNAVCVPMSEWVGARMRDLGEVVCDSQKYHGSRWPPAAFGGAGQVFRVEASTAVHPESPSLQKFLSLPLRPLSVRATRGFLSRTAKSKLRFTDGFLEALEVHAAELEFSGASG